jgi:outer membrane protein OmpA-like peptidoglycan-associated protein
MHVKDFFHLANLEGPKVKRHLVTLSLLLTGAFASIAAAQDLPQKDLPGTHDHPIISRFDGSVIIGYKTIDFDAMTLPLSPFKGSSFGENESVKGRITRIAYAAPAGKSVLEISTNFEQALQNAGFQKRFTCFGTPEDQACGDRYHIADSLLPERLFSGLTSNDTLAYHAIIDTLSSGATDVFVETARLNRSNGPVDVVLFISGHDDTVTGIYLQICESKPMATGQVSADAKGSELDMAQGLAQQGHVALYGIHFGTDSAVINDDSASTLDQMAALMKSQPALKVYIVGHTDNTGALDHNLALSTQRAQAVVKALQDKGVPAGSMTAKGLASLAPVAPNSTAEGKAKNRRVELVEQ